MNKTELLTLLDEGREGFLETIEGLSNSAMLETGINDQWSVKDVLAHLTIWEAELVKLLWQVRKGRTPTTVHFGSVTVDELNAKWYQSNRERALERILKDFHGVRLQTIRRVESLSENDLLEENKYEWQDGVPLWKWIVNDSVEHEAEHGAQIIAWRKANGF
jgi:hypothetical protein